MIGRKYNLLQWALLELVWIENLISKHFLVVRFNGHIGAMEIQQKIQTMYTQEMSKRLAY